MNTNKIVSAVAVGVALATPLIGFAQPQDVPQVIGLFESALGILQTVFYIVAAIFIIIAAFKYLTAQGDPEKVGTARQMVIYAVIAIAVALLALVIQNIVASFLGAPAPTTPVPIAP
jgi:phosphoglycerol transferase MdoB-like AlkP superfamily enzyme